ncbi:hypothetical protein O181_019779 [Austropuccinia psidii MF-1]|uniref:Uncharacterized protein n=1 Tax=Austropuccinia psidii MF-1 TaxID=1389203 RepID=A0A9Q3CA79_9BASI|nr:hypothetical protein [Austropuccinia psidii MF-1]
MAIEPVGPSFGHGPPWTIIPSMASENHQSPPDQLSKHSPQLKGNSFHSSMHPVLKVAGVVHIWYYIPLCTIFAQKFNGEVFRTKSHLFNSMFQNPIPILKEDLFNSSVWQLMAAIRRSFKDPNHLTLQELGCTLIQDASQGLFLQVLRHFNHLSRHQVFQYSLDNSIGPYR